MIHAIFQKFNMKKYNSSSIPFLVIIISSIRNIDMWDKIYGIKIYFIYMFLLLKIG